MADKLGILVTSDRYMTYVVNITDAACARKKKVSVFFTGRGVKLTQTPLFKKLTTIAEVSVCEASFRALGLSETACGMAFNRFTSQATNAEMINGCDRLVVF
jgi:peroxiredoxin family protein